MTDLKLRFSASSYQVIFALTGDGSIISENNGEGKILKYPNGWYKCIFTINDTIGETAEWQIGNWSFDNVDGTNGFYIWGMQVEAGSFPTSYIPTSGSELTRSDDVAQITGDNFSSWYNQSEGTIYAKFGGQTYATGNSSRILSFADDDLTTMSGGNGILFGSHTGGPDQQRWRIRGPSVTYFPLATEPVGSTALAYAPSDLAMVFDGGTVESSTNSPPTALDRLNIFPANAPICRITYYNERLTNEQLETITL